MITGLFAVEAQQELIQLADRLQSLFEITILFERLANLRNLLGTQTDLAGFPAGVTHCQDRKRMTLAACALQTSRGVMERALQQRTAENSACGGEPGCEFIPFAVVTHARQAVTSLILCPAPGGGFNRSS